jgi:hypothetical protein
VRHPDAEGCASIAKPGFQDDSDKMTGVRGWRDLSISFFGSPTITTADLTALRFEA